jgi:N-acetylated-alpha-linked acidic dipeptidase
VLPLDYAAWAGDFRGELEKLCGQLGNRLDIAPLLDRTEQLQAKAKAVRGRAGDHAKAAAINHALVGVSRALVPIDYTRGDRFDHDPALGQAPWPPLDPIRALASAKDGDDAKFARVAAVRARNRVAHALDHANVALDACLSGG